MLGSGPFVRRNSVFIVSRCDLHHCYVGAEIYTEPVLNCCPQLTQSMRPRIAFGIQSAVHRADTLQQLVSTLGDHPVVIHHDFSQQPDFVIKGPNVQFVQDPAKTGWADWGLISGISKTIEHCLASVDFDYFQLLSPVDMPIRPLSEFERYISTSQCDFDCDTVPLDADEMAFQAFAYRAYALQGSLPYRVLWRLWLAFFGSDPDTEARAGLAIPVSARSRPDGRIAPTARWAAKASHLIVDRLRRRDPLLARYPLNVGGMWFGASRAGCEYLVEQLRDQAFVARFRHYFCAGEMLFNTAVAISGRSNGQGNHAISRYIGPRPQWIGLDDLDELIGTGKFFSRKFPDQPDAPVRLEMLERLGLGRGRNAGGRAGEVAAPPPVAEPGDAVPAGARTAPVSEAEDGEAAAVDAATLTVAARSSQSASAVRRAPSQSHAIVTNPISNPISLAR